MSEPTPIEAARPAANWRVRGGASFFFCVAAGLIWAFSGPSAEQLVDEARLALASGEPRKARQLAEQALKRSPGMVRALVTAGEAAASLGRREDALAYYDQIEDDGSLDAVVGIGAAADLLVQLGRLSEAEVRLRKLLEMDGQHVLAHRRLAAILILEGRRRDSAPHLMALLRAGEASIDDLALLGNLEQIFDNQEAVDHFRRLAPDDPLPILGAARLAIRGGETEKAAVLLRNAVAAAPGAVEVHVQLGRVLVELGDDGEFYRWHAALPPEANDNPDVWAVRGEWAQKREQVREAMRCYWEAIRRDPNHWKANYQLARLLVSSGDGQRARPFFARAERLQQLAETVRWILLEPADTSRMLKAAELTESLGRLWEAWAWYAVVSRRQPENVEARDRRDRLRRRLHGEMPRTLTSANPTRQIDLLRHPLPSWMRHAPILTAPSLSERDYGTPEASVSFTDAAASAGLAFTFYNGDDPNESGMRIYQSFGGGVAVLDFDGNGWPDLYFTQACDWPAPADQQRYRDSLYRNLGNGRFQEVTSSCGAAENGYSLGVAAGDFDSDGFADLYVANIGRNRLLQNNGDGTFSDVTDASGLSGELLSSSCALADLNGDGLPDIYDVSYLAGDGPFYRICNESVGTARPEDLPRACPPTYFPAEQDRLYVNRGNGTFENATATVGIVVPDGKGLGVLAADIDGAGGTDVYVANDTTPNFLFLNTGGHLDGPLSFSEEAVIRGCALDADGRPQAGMGVAFGDVDGNGLFDLFVTNFYKEYNTLYLQQSGGLFTDGTADAGLKQPSMLMLGFGTQFLDADLDGWLDLVVANGHVDDFRFQGTEFQMRPQFFSNRGGGRFVEVLGESLGDYFQKKRLGRGLARIDWNRDGREDFVVSHLQSPAALVTNETAEVGHFLAISFRGISSSRDAIGAVVRISAGGRTRVGQLSAGDGYCASNQRQLVFGLGTVNRVDEVAIRWPSGREQTFAGIPADQELLVIEGCERFWPLPR